MNSLSASTNSQLSTIEISGIVEQLKHNQHRNSTKCCYYTVWKLFNEFFVKLDLKPSNWEDRLMLFVGYLVQNNKQSSTVKSYVLAIKAVLKMNGTKIAEDAYLLLSLVRACKLCNDKIRARLPIHKNVLRIILEMTEMYFLGKNQPYCSSLYRTLFSMAYFGLFRVCELTASDHQIQARDVHVGYNKKKILFVW